MLKDCIKNGLLSFQKANKVLPKRIIAYREGIGGRKNNPTVTMEINAFKEAIKEAYKQVNPKTAGDMSDEDILKTVKIILTFLDRSCLRMCK